MTFYGGVELTHMLVEDKVFEENKIHEVCTSILWARQEESVSAIVKDDSIH